MRSRIQVPRTMMRVMSSADSRGFEEETRIFLQERLRTILGWVGIVLVVAAAAMLVARPQSGMPFGEGLVEFTSNLSTAGILLLALLSGASSL